MVRLKHRYILFEILYPPYSQPKSREEKVKFNDFSGSPKKCLLNLHASSHPSINAKSLANLFRRVIHDHYGESALGTVGSSIIVKYFSNKTSTGIIRCSRNDFHLVVAAVGLVNKVENQSVLMRCVHVSGTIRKCEDFSIRRTKKLMADMGKKHHLDKGLLNLITTFEADDNEN